jgi:hypothetical protein
MQMTRAATTADLDAIAAITASARRRLAEWSPTWWRPAAAADEIHRVWLQHLIEADGPIVRVTTEHAHVVGCAAAVPQGAQWTVDDVGLADDDRWADAGVELLGAVAERPAVTCVPTHHLARRAASEAAHLHHVSSYWIRHTNPVAGTLPTPLDPRTPLPAAPLHTFGGALDPNAPGALALGDGEGGAVVGSPPITAPPVYDPGGTVCIVDRVVGDPAPLLERALEVSGGRGDRLMAVVVAVDDDRLRGGLKELHFERTVDVFTWPTASERHRHR